MKKYKIIFFGTPEFSAKILENLLDTPFRPIACVTAPDQPSGRQMKLASPAVKILAKNSQIPLYQFPTLRKGDAARILKNLKPDLFVVAAYGLILPQKVLDIPKFGCVNIHPSLLPKYRGASPIQYAILNGDAETGITLMQMTAKMDDGPIIAQKHTKVYNKDTSRTLRDRLLPLCTQLLIENLPKIFSREIHPQEQDEKLATFTKIIDKENGKISWQKSAKSIEQQIRAFTPWPGTFTFFLKNGKKYLLKIKGAQVVSEDPPIRPGNLFTSKKDLIIKCGVGALKLEKIQIEGKNEISGQDFRNGHQEIKNFLT